MKSRAGRGASAHERETAGPSARIYFGTFPSEVRPEPIEDDGGTRLARLEAKGAAWGARKRQVIAGEQLVRRRRALRAP